MMRPKVSVILPVYNRPEYLQPAIASVLHQTFSDWELLVVDDGSDDAKTISILAALREPRVRVFWQSHTGSPALARNVGIINACGNYLAFLDSDDLWLPNKLAVQLTALRARRALGWSYGAFDRIDERGRQVDSPLHRSWSPHQSRMVFKLITGEAQVATPTVMMRRDLALRLGGFDAQFECGEDYDLWIRAAMHSDVVAVEDVLAKVRVYPSSYSRNPLMMRRNWMKLYQKFAHLASDAGDQRVARSQIAVAALRLSGLLAQQPGGSMEAWQLLRCHGSALVRRPSRWIDLARIVITLLLGPDRMRRCREALRGWSIR